MNKFLFIFGTRPEAIKLAPLIKRFQSEQLFHVKVCVTAQHRELLDQVLAFFNILPDYDLNLMTSNQSLNQLSGSLFHKIDEVYLDFEPNYVFVHGDTTTSSICAFAAFHRNIKIVHVEAGLRTYDKHSPFPEEINRQLTSKLADIHLAPTLLAKSNLTQEGVNTKNILVTGNTIIDALFLGITFIENGHFKQEINYLKRLINPDKKLILITSHRRENFGKNLEHLCLAIKEIAQQKDVQIIYPVHLNPNIYEPVHQFLGKLANVQLLKPLDYPSFIYLMQASYFIITDSGGIQEEAPALGKPVLVTRQKTERPEALQIGAIKLVGNHKHDITKEALSLILNATHYSKMSNPSLPYGDGKAVERISQYFKSEVIKPA